MTPGRGEVNQCAMISPHLIVFRRVKKNSSPGRRSIRDLSRDYFRTEHIWFYMAELILLGVLALVALWPVLLAAAAIATLPV